MGNCMSASTVVLQETDFSKSLKEVQPQPSKRLRIEAMPMTPEGSDSSEVQVIEFQLNDITRVRKRDLERHSLLVSKRAIGKLARRQDTDTYSAQLVLGRLQTAATKQK
jgi:hypothetical protein